MRNREDDFITLDDEVEEDIVLSIDEDEGDNDSEERIDERLEDILANNDSDLLIDLEYEEDTEEEKVVIPREGIDVEPLESLKSFLKFSEDRLSFLRKSINTMTSSYDDNERDLLISLMNIRTASFLSASDRSQILSYVEAVRDIESIIQLFIQGRKIDKKDMLELSSYVREVVVKYKSFLDRKEASDKIRQSIILYVIKGFVEEPANDLSKMIEYVEKGNVAYVDWIRSSSEGTEYGCGNCSHINKSESGFFKIVVTERSFRANENVTLFPLARVCDSCSSLNILTYEEHQILQHSLNKRYEDSLSDWKRRFRKLTVSGNIMSYDMRRGSFSKILEDVYLKSVQIEEDREAEDKVNWDIVKSWYFDTLKVTERIESEKIRNDKIFFLKDGSLEENEDDHFDAIREVTQIYSFLLKEDYSLLKRNALNSFLVYLKENSTLYNVLSADPEILKESILLSRGYLDNEEDFDFEYVYSMLFKQLSLSVDKFDKSKVEEYKELIVGRLEEIENDLEKDRETSAFLMTKLNKLALLFRYVDVQPTAKIDLSDYKGILCRKEVREWIDRVSDLMILNKLSPKILDHWRSLGKGKIKNKKYVSDGRVVKTFDETIRSIMNDYSKVLDTSSSPRSMVTQFIGSTFVNPSVYTALFNLKQSLETLDYYKFSFSVKELEGFTHTSASFSGLVEMIRKALRPCKNFCEEQESKSTGNKTLDYYLYHYGDQFSKEEIESDISKIYGMEKRTFKIKREEGEKFSSYLERLRTADVNEVRYEVDSSASFFNDLKKYYAYVYGAFEFVKFLNETGSETRNLILMNDLVYNSYYYGKKSMFEFLGIPRVPMRETSSDLGKDLDFRDYRYSLILENVIYPSHEFNGSDRTDSLDIKEVMKEDYELYQEQTKYFKDFGEEVYEYYIGGGDEVSDR